MDEEAEWKAFRDALGKDKKEFRRMFANSRLYISACSYSAKPIRIQPIFMAILFHHYQQLVRVEEELGVQGDDGMSLFPTDDVLLKEIESWKGFSDSLRAEDREIFEKMLRGCFRFAAAINAKGEPFPTEALIMALLLSEQKQLSRLIEHVDGERK